MSCLMQETEKKRHEKRRDGVNILQALASKSKSHNRVMSVTNVELNLLPKGRISTQTGAQYPSISHNLKHSEVTLEGDLQIGECIPSLTLAQKSKKHSRKQKHAQKGKGNADTNIKPLKKTRRSKKKIMQNVSTDNRIGYKATKVVSVWKIMYSRSTDEHWPSKHILSESPATFEGACKVLDHILLKDVGVHVSVSQRVKDCFSDLKILLMDFIKKHKRLSPYTYLLTHCLESEFKIKPVDIAQEINSLELESICTGTYIKRGYKRQFIGHGTQKTKRHKQEQSVNGNMIEQHSNCSITSQSEGDVQLSVSELALPLTTKDAFQPGCSKSLEVAGNSTVLQLKPVQNWQQTKTRLQPIEQSMVSKFVKELLRKVVPIELFGCKRNARVFKRLCVRLTHSGKFQNLRLGSLMSGLKTLNIPWLRSVAEPTVKQNIFAKMILWLFEEFVMVILRIHFFVTEGLQQRNRLLFYRPRVHQKVTDKALLHMVKSKKLKVIDNKMAAELEKKETFPGIAVLRFIPKMTGARPILMTRDRYDIAQSVKIAKTYLTQVAAMNPISIKPAAANKLHEKLCTLFDYWKKDNQQQVYFVQTDISDAYGSICHQKLYHILKKIISADQTYALKKYKFVTMKKGKLQYIFKQAFDHLPCVVPRNSIQIDAECTTVKHVNGQNLLSFIHGILKDYVIYKGDQKFVMTCGQPQGGRLSSVLCDLYYSDLDRTQLGEFQNDEDLLLRAVDDYLFITTDLDRAIRFLRKMERGFPEYGSYVNTKTQTNVPPEYGSVCTELKYCGYVVDTKLMHITGDYARYMYQDIAHSMRLSQVKHPGKFLQKRMTMLSTLKLNPLTLDESYNSREIVLTNIFHAALLQAFRFHSIIKNCFDRKNLNQGFLAQIVYVSAGRIGCEVLRITSKYCKGSTLEFITICWIVYRAFFLRMFQVRSYYFRVLKAIDWMLKNLAQRIQDEVYDELRKLTLHMPDIFQTLS